MRFLTIMLLLAGTAFAQNKCTSCKTEEPTSYTITKLTDCEKDKLAAAKEKLEAIKEEILEAHGKPNQITLSSFGPSVSICPYIYPIHIFTLQDDTYVVEIKEIITGNCGSVIIWGR